MQLSSFNFIIVPSLWWKPKLLHSLISSPMLTVRGTNIGDGLSIYLLLLSKICFGGFMRFVKKSPSYMDYQVYQLHFLIEERMLYRNKFLVTWCLLEYTKISRKSIYHFSDHHLFHVLWTPKQRLMVVVHCHYITLKAGSTYGSAFTFKYVLLG